MQNIKFFIELTRLNRPIGYMLLFWPCLWGLTITYNFNSELETNETNQGNAWRSEVLFNNKLHKNIVFAESFFSSEVIKKIPKFGELKQEPLGKFLFNDTNIEKRETYVAIYKQEDNNFIGRKCIYAYQEELFSVIEVFLFHE